MEPAKRLIEVDVRFLGVCAGLADYTGLDLFCIRVAAIAVTRLGSGLPLLA